MKTAKYYLLPLELKAMPVKIGNIFGCKIIKNMYITVTEKNWTSNFISEMNKNILWPWELQFYLWTMTKVECFTRMLSKRGMIWEIFTWRRFLIIGKCLLTTLMYEKQKFQEHSLISKLRKWGKINVYFI